MSELFLIRHLPAVPVSPAMKDGERGLSERGRNRSKLLVRALTRMGVRFDRLYHSPALRAVETADALMCLTGGESAVRPHLTATPSPALLRDLAGNCVALVGHQPHLGSLATWLTHGDSQGGDNYLITPGGFAWLVGEVGPGRMRLRALVSARLLRRLAR